MGLFDFFMSKKDKELSKKRVPSEEENPYEHLMWSIHGLRDQFKKENKLGFVGDQIVIRKTPSIYEVDCNLIMGNGQAMKMGYTLELSARKYLPPKIDILLEAHGETVIEQNRW